MCMLTGLAAMLRPKVRSHVCNGRESSFAGVRPTMGNEMAAPGKALTALVAAEGFLARVRPTMDGEIAAG